MTNDHLSWLQEWYASHCDGDWEHEFGVKIDTLDNPGWSLRVDLTATELEGANFSSVRHEQDEQTWWSCEVKKNQFVAHCGPRNLPDAIRVLKEWHSSIAPASADRLRARSIK